MDWAEKEAERVNREPVYTTGDRENLIADALRRAKAEGVRQAAKYSESARHYEHIMQVAAEIEKGNA